MTDLLPLPRTVSELRTLESLMSERGVTHMSADYREFFGSRERMLKIEDNVLLVFRHDDVKTLSTIRSISNVPTDIYMAASYPGTPEQPFQPEELDQVHRFHRNQFFTALPPAHKVVKPIFARAMSPKVIAALRPVAARTAESLVARFTGAGEFDFHKQFSERYAIEFWAEVLGMTPEETREFSIASAKLAPIATGSYGRDDVIAMNQAIPVYFDILSAAIGRAVRKGAHPFLTEAQRRFAEVVGTVDDLPDSFEALMAVGLIDGFQAAPGALTNVLLTLLENRAHLEALRHGSETVRAAVGEALRLKSPVPVTARYVLEDVEYDGMRLAAGTMIVFLWGASNCDPNIQPHADRFDPARAHDATTLFGGGVQICPGRDIGRLLIEEAISALTDMSVTVELVGEPRMLEGLSLTPPTHPAVLPVAITTAALPDADLRPRATGAH